MILRRPRSTLLDRRIHRIVGKRTVFDLAKVRTAWSGRIEVSEEIQHALEHKEPVVALESAIITHGMPYPTNLSTTLSLEAILRSRSVNPATIALIDGTVRVGLFEDELQRLSDPQVDSERKVKVSRRDLAPALSMGLSGGTTVSGTMYVAHSVGIELFVTGGIGGVHRGAEKTFDISADLLELGRTPVGVVCAGAKSILDIPRTLEVLETNGVCVSTFGETKDFPAFYSPASGSQSPWNANTAASAAKLIHCGLTLPQPLSTLLAVPIPSEHAQAGEAVQKLVEQAVAESIEQGIKGNEVTPWLLKRVGELSSGETLRLNIALIENNARVGAEIALELSKLKRQSTDERGSATLGHHSAPHLANTGRIPVTGQRRQYTTVQNKPLPPPRVVVIGAAALDITSSAGQPIAPGSTTPGTNYLTPGGVARNIAESAHRFLPPNSVQLVSAVGTTDGQPDAAGVILVHEMKAAGLRTDGLQMIEGEKTATCSLLLDQNNDLVAGVADMDIAKTHEGDWTSWAGMSPKPDMVVFDCNIPGVRMEGILAKCNDLQVPTFCDPTSTQKAKVLREAILRTNPRTVGGRRRLTHIAPNLIETDILFKQFFSPDSIERILGEQTWDHSIHRDTTLMGEIDEFCNLASQQLHGTRDWQWLDARTLFRMAVLLLLAESVWVKAGRRGVIHLQRSMDQPPSTSPRTFVQPVGSGYISLSLYPAPIISKSDIVSTTGAGDTLVGALVAGLVQGKEEAEFVKEATQAAGRTLRSIRAVG